MYLDLSACDYEPRAIQFGLVPHLVQVEKPCARERISADTENDSRRFEGASPLSWQGNASRRRGRSASATDRRTLTGVTGISHSTATCADVRGGAPPVRGELGLATRRYPASPP